MSQKN